MAHTGRRGVAYRLWLGNSRERERLGDIGVDVTIILKRIFSKYEGVSTGLADSG